MNSFLESSASNQEYMWFVNGFLVLVVVSLFAEGVAIFVMATFFSKRPQRNEAEQH